MKKYSSLRQSKLRCGALLGYLPSSYMLFCFVSVDGTSLPQLIVKVSQDPFILLLEFSKPEEMMSGLCFFIHPCFSGMTFRAEQQ